MNSNMSNKRADHREKITGCSAHSTRETKNNSYYTRNPSCPKSKAPDIMGAIEGTFLHSGKFTLIEICPGRVSIHSV